MKLAKDLWVFPEDKVRLSAVSASKEDDEDLTGRWTVVGMADDVRLETFAL